MPVFLGDGFTPRATDPKRIRWVKMLNKVQTRGGARVANDALIRDPTTVIKRKLLCALQGVDYTG